MRATSRQPHRRAVGVGAQHDVAELFHRAQLPLQHHRREDRLPGQVGQLADGARRDLRVLRADRRGHVGGRQVEADQLGRVDPDAHRPFGAEQLRLADAGHALQFGQHRARRIVAQRDRVELRVVRRQDREQQEVRACLVDAHALLRHRRRQPRRGAAQPVLHVDLRLVRIGAGLEAQRDLPAAVGLADRFHVDQPGRAVHLALDDADHAVFERLRRRAGVGGVDDDRRRRDGRVLRHRQLRDRHAAEHQDEQRDDPREDRAVDEKCGHALRSPLSEPEAGRAAEAAAGADAAPAGGARRRPAPRHRFHRRVAAQLLEAVDHHPLAGFQAVGDDPLRRPAPSRR